MHTCAQRSKEQKTFRKVKMITTALSKIETSEAAQHTADNDKIGAYGEFYYKVPCPLFE